MSGIEFNAKIIGRKYVNAIKNEPISVRSTLGSSDASVKHLEFKKN